MNNILLTVNKGLEFMTPFVKKLWGSAVSITAAAGDSIKKSNKKAKMHIKLMKLKNTLELISSIALLIATVIALLLAVGEYIKKR